MELQPFTIAVFGMGAVSAIAALTALMLLLRHLSRSSMHAPRTRSFDFDAPDPSPAATFSAAPPAPSPDPTPASPPTPPRLSLFLIAPDAPEALVTPVRLVRGRILEINLPVGLSWTGTQDLDDLAISIQLPNEITYGASLEHMLQQPPPANLPGATISYASALARTTISILTRRAPGGLETWFALPVSVTQMSARAHPVLLTVSAAGIEPIARNYVLELTEDAGVEGEPEPAAKPDAWVCRPDDSRRERDPQLPLDRIAAANFSISRS